MIRGETVKTTVRLPADLHWRFQKERTTRRLSNERAICEAFSIWVTESKEPGPRHLSEKSRVSARGLARITIPERQWVERLLQILRNRNDPARALAVRSVIQALSGNPEEGHANQTGFAISAKSADDFEKRVEQLHQDTKDARRNAGKSDVPGKRVGGRKT